MNLAKTVILAGVLLLQASFLSAATLGEFTLCQDYNKENMRPVGVKNVFSSEKTKVYATVQVRDAVEGDELSATWLYHPKGSSPVLMVQTKTPLTGNRYVVFSYILNEGQQLDLGLYSVRMYLNNKPSAELFFTIEKPAPAPVAAPAPETSPAQQSQQAQQPQSMAGSSTQTSGLPPFTIYNDPAGRFSAKLPGTWFPAQVTQPTAVYLSQNKNQSPVETIAVSAYPIGQSGVFNRMDAILTIRDKLLAEAKGIKAEKLKDSLVDAENEDDKAWAMAFTYQGPKEQTVIDKKLIISSPGWIYVLNFMYTPERSEQMRQIAQTVIKSFERKK